MIEIKGFVAWAGLKEAVFAEFGEGLQDNEHSNGYVWFGKTTAMTLRYDESLKEGAYCLFSIKIRNQQDEYKKQKAKERAEKGF